MSWWTVDIQRCRSARGTYTLSLTHNTLALARPILVNPALATTLPPMMFLRPNTTRRHALTHQHTSPRSCLKHIVHTLNFERRTFLVGTRPDGVRYSFSLGAGDEVGRVR
jgi:hypothetical protein